MKAIRRSVAREIGGTGKKRKAQAYGLALSGRFPCRESPEKGLYSDFTTENGKALTLSGF